MKKILTSKEIQKYSTILGAKTTRLCEIQDAAIPTLPFVALPYRSFAECIQSNGALQREKVSSLASTLLEVFPQSVYAVRSSALGEDTLVRSEAGQFTTRLAVEPKDLAQALGEVLLDAYLHLQGDMKRFSLLIQQYRKPVFAGVAFSRNPKGTREVVIDYTHGTGEAVVGGTASNMVYVLGNDVRPVTTFTKKQRTALLRVAELARQLEKRFLFPQDVEWSMYEDTVYILQARPITSFTKAQYDQLLYLESLLTTTDFYYEKSKIVESFPNPTQLGVSMLRTMYSPAGPIQKAYERFGVHYYAQDIFALVGDELYVDKEREVQCFFPVYTYFKSKDGTAHIGRWSGVRKSLRNMRAVKRMSLAYVPSLRKELETRLQRQEEYVSFDDAWQGFVNDYVTIFSVNILAEKAFRALGQASSVLGQSVGALLRTHVGVVQGCEDVSPLMVPTFMQQYRGNSLNVTDDSPFVVSKYEVPNVGHTVATAWWQLLKSKEREQYGVVIRYAQEYERLREYGRWLTVKHIHTLREKALALAYAEGFSDTTHIYHATLKEIFDGEVNAKVCTERALDFAQGDLFCAPYHLASFPLLITQDDIGVSPGVAKGTLVTKETLYTIKGPKILFVSALTPDLTKYFDDIVGIIGRHGSLLSHLAIVAREHKLPVVVSQQSDLVPGTIVTIDGGTGGAVCANLEG